MAAAIRKHVVMTNTSSHVTALWVLHSWLIDCFVISPRLCIRSATKGCGKTLKLDVIGRRAKSFDPATGAPIDCPTIPLHPDCVSAYFAAQAGQGNGQDQPGTTASVPFVITRAMKEQLYARGYSEEEVSNLTPQQARDALDDAF
jgi:hypothetical protein